MHAIKGGKTSKKLPQKKIRKFTKQWVIEKIKQADPQAFFILSATALCVMMTVYVIFMLLISMIVTVLSLIW